MKTDNIFVSSLCIYPVKSCRGIHVNSWEINRYGFKYDRFWTIINKNDNKILTQRELPKLALIAPRIDELNSELILSAPEVQDLHLPLLPKKEFCKKYQIDLWGDQVIGYCCGDEAANWLTNFLKVSASLLFKSNEDTRIIRKNLPKGIDFQPETAFADTFPFLITSEESLHDLNGRLSEPVTFRNFRPNIVVKGCSKSFEEDTWKEIIIGTDKENIFYVSCRSTRCIVPNVNPDTGIRNKLEPSKTLSSYRRVDLGAKYHACFGMNVIHSKSGIVLSVGDPVTVLTIGEHIREKY
ncbi:hypothetical protein Glove_208g117 [Diversispora epigaea]|uniref:MOSC domain-containing protein n=1 Tax=Diversispora epigaea TaxID=1348612 RepID=A0A397ILT2_9GLOM|nr:hypothetical protein Glove_208g117 [Diversispora epigaea]